MDVDDEAGESVQRGQAGSVVGVGHDVGLDAELAQGVLHEPVEVGRYHDADVPGGDESGDRTVRGGGLLEALGALVVVGLEVGAQHRLPLEGGARQGGQEVVVSGGLPEPLLVPGVGVADSRGAFCSGQALDEVLLDVPRGRHACRDRGARPEQDRVRAGGVTHSERELDVWLHN
ncbi:hypothetical protein [Streptomyces sp. Agncl-13]|uniref:hypothetical protein n=1 Tax=Streptomyces sp. Agncl-13 TaxID=3400628 RepID=UPI003A88641C